MKPTLHSKRVWIQSHLANSRLWSFLSLNPRHVENPDLTSISNNVLTGTCYTAIVLWFPIWWWRYRFEWNRGVLFICWDAAGCGESKGLAGFVHNRCIIRLFTCRFWLIYEIVAEWMKSSFAQRKSHVELLLESLEHRDAEIRFTNARRLFYILQGR